MRGAIIFCLAAASLFPNAALATDQSFTPGFTGDWNGERTTLKDQGWQFQVRGDFEAAYDPSGGDAQAAAGAGEMDFAALADLGKLIGDDGGVLEAKITDRFGANLVTAAGLNTLMQVQEIWGRGDIWRLSQLAYSQALFKKKLNIEVGRLNPGGDFDVFACNFQNLNFCGPPAGNIDGDYWFNSPVSQWGARAKVNVSDDLDVEGGVYQINPENLTRGFTFDFSGGKGALIPYDIEWKPKLLGTLPGDFQLGGWYSDMTAADIFYDTNHDPAAVTSLPSLMVHGRRGFYLSGRQQLTGEAPAKDAPAGTNGEGLTAFVNFTQSDRSTSLLDNQFAIGAIYKGAIPGRPKDEIGLAFGATHVNAQAALGENLHDAAAQMPFEPVQHTEYVTELDYRIIAMSGVEVSPNLQLITDPGGVAQRSDVFVLGLRTALRL
ncbi:MAG TPA: carbohydrate porin [Rhizomicrobium sp.]|jgi:porin|nr:carbohydrate porin [Rhizomicrobium sp.]